MFSKTVEGVVKGIWEEISRFTADTDQAAGQPVCWRELGKEIAGRGPLGLEHISNTDFGRCPFQGTQIWLDQFVEQFMSQVNSKEISWKFVEL